MNKPLKPLLIATAIAAVTGLAQAGGTAPWHTDSSNYDESTRTLSSETSSMDAAKTRDEVKAEYRAYRDAGLIEALDLENTIPQVELEQRLATANSRFEASQDAVAAAEQQRELISMAPTGYGQESFNHPAVSEPQPNMDGTLQPTPDVASNEQRVESMR